MPFQIFPGGFWMNTVANVGEIWMKYAFWNHTWIPNSNPGRDNLWIMAINCGYSSPFRHIELDVVGYINVYTMGPPFTIAKLVYNSNFTNWFMVPITTVTGAFANQRSHNWWDWWDPHVCVYIYIHTYITYIYIYIDSGCNIILNIRHVYHRRKFRSQTSDNMDRWKAEMERVRHTYIHIHTYMHTYIHPCMHTYMHTYIHAYIHTYIHACIHTYIIYISIYTYVYIYISDGISHDIITKITRRWLYFCPIRESYPMKY